MARQQTVQKSYHLYVDQIVKFSVMECNSSNCNQTAIKTNASYSLAFNAKMVMNILCSKKASRFSLFLEDPVFQVI